MEYTVNGLARLAGVSVRTLHWYDEIGLLRPARVTEAGYRMYGPDEVDALQSILFYRALGVPLKQDRCADGGRLRRTAGRFAEPSRRAALPARADGRPAGHAGQNHFDGRREMCDDRRREI